LRSRGGRARKKARAVPETAVRLTSDCGVR
jgi:hypothetical protein